MEQTGPKLDLGSLDAEPELRDDLVARYGAVMGQAIYDHLICPVAMNKTHPNCTDVLELSEIAHRLRQHVRVLIQQTRAQQAAPRPSWSENVVVLFTRAGGKGDIFRAYRLYKKINRDFHDMYDACMNNVQGLDPECVRRWYIAQGVNDVATGYRG